MKYVIPTVVFVAIIAFIIMFLSLATQKPCIRELGTIVYYSDMKSGECCDNLVEKSPEGFTGMGFCVNPECDVVCLGCDSYSEGIYMQCPDKSPQLVKYIQCC